MHIRVAIFSMVPYLYLDDDGTFSGPIFNMVETLSQKLNFTFELVIPPDGCSVSLPLPNGSWSGFRGMIDKNQTELVLGPEILVSEQLEGVKLGNHYLFTSLQFLATAGDVEAMDFSKIIMAFDIEIWYTLLALLFILTLSVSIFDAFGQYLEGNKAEIKLSQLETNFWLFLATFFLEGTPRTPSNHNSRFLFGLWLAAVIVMMNAFSSQFKTALMVKGADDTMYTVEDLSKRPELTIYLRKSGLLQELFEKSPLEVYQQIWRNIVAKGMDGIVDMEAYFERNVYDNIKAGKGVILSGAEIPKAVLQNFCRSMKGDRRFYFMREHVYFSFIAFYTPLTFPDGLLKEINKRIRWISEGNLIDKWMTETYKYYDTYCTTSDIVQSENPDTLGLNLGHILPVIYFVLTIQGFALVVLVIEILSKLPKE